MHALDRAQAFCAAYGLRVPILMAPMAGASPPALAAAVASAGGMGACGCLTLTPDEIGAWANDLRAATNGAFQLNTWIPDPPPKRDAEATAKVAAFLADWGPPVDPATTDRPQADFDAQLAAMLAAGPAVISSIMGLFPPATVAEMQARRIAWFATVTTAAEGEAALSAGADVLVAQGAEAGGHRGTFAPRRDAAADVGLVSLIPALADLTERPIIATGGIADARGVAAALTLGASAVQIGTALLRTPEAGIAPAWADAIGAAQPEGTVVTRAYSGRRARMLRNAYTEAAHQIDPLPYPLQAAMTSGLRAEAAGSGDLSRMQAFCGQSGALARAEPAKDIVTGLWDASCTLLEGRTQ